MRNIKEFVTFPGHDLRLDGSGMKAGWWLVMRGHSTSWTTGSAIQWTKGSAIQCVGIHVRGHEGKYTMEKRGGQRSGDGWQLGKMAVSDRGATWQSEVLDWRLAVRAPRVHRWLAVRAHKIIDETIAVFRIAAKVFAEPPTSIIQR